MTTRNTLVLLAALALAVAPDAAAKKWRVYENCTLVENPANDGDSFHVRVKNRRYIFRLYFVDAPETDNSVPDRVAEQAAYFGIDERAAIQVGKEAAKFTEKFLADGFTTYSKLSDALGRSEKDRDYAIIEAGGKDLGEELVRNGLGRIYGTGVDLPDGKSEKLMWWRLKSAEREAKDNKRGAWGVTPTLTRAEQFSAMNAPREIKEQDIVLQQTIAVYSAADATRQVGLLQRGAQVRVLQATSPTMVRIRFTTGEGKAYEAQCRMVDVGL